MNDPLHDIGQYSPTMTISQLMKFCEKKNIEITRAMIQNYIRDGLMPSPVNKRLYTHKHIAALVVISRLKTVFDIPSIKKTLVPFLDDEGLPMEIYSEILAKTQMITQKWLNEQGEIFKTEKDGGALLLMSCTADLKRYKGDDLQ